MESTVQARDTFVVYSRETVFPFESKVPGIETTMDWLTTTWNLEDLRLVAVRQKVDPTSVIVLNGFNIKKETCRHTYVRVIFSEGLLAQIQLRFGNPVGESFSIEEGVDEQLVGSIFRTYDSLRKPANADEVLRRRFLKQQIDVFVLPITMHIAMYDEIAPGESLTISHKEFTQFQLVAL